LVKLKKTFVSDILKALMLKKSIKTAQLARAIKVPRQTLQRIVSGSSPNPHDSTLEPIANYFNVSVSQIKGEKELPSSLSFFPTVFFEKDVYKIPVLKWDNLDRIKQAHANDTLEKIAITSDINKNSFGLVLSDSSMAPFFTKGTILIIDPERDYRDRSFILAKLGEENLFLFRQILIDGQFKYLKPLSPDLNKFEMRIFNNNKDEVLGVLIEARKHYADM
jgi:transcriptional regulator with XRE-family HTH domain